MPRPLSAEVDAQLQGHRRAGRVGVPKVRAVDPARSGGEASELHFLGAVAAVPSDAQKDSFSFALEAWYCAKEPWAPPLQRALRRHLQVVSLPGVNVRGVSRRWIIYGNGQASRLHSYIDDHVKVQFRHDLPKESIAGVIGKDGSHLALLRSLPGVIDVGVCPLGYSQSFWVMAASERASEEVLLHVEKRITLTQRLIRQPQQPARRLHTGSMELNPDLIVEDAELLADESFGAFLERNV